MRKIIALVIFVLSTSAFADEKNDWTGFYGSAMIGHDWGKVSEGDSFLTGYTGGYLNAYRLSDGHSPSIKGTSLNLKLGFNKQIDANLIGVELGASLQTAKSKNGVLDTYWNSTYYPPNTGNDGPETNPNTTQTKIQSYMTLSGRIGHIFNETTLIYIKSGLAAGHIKRRITDWSGNYFNPGSVLSDGNTELGYVLGIGAEHKLNEKWSLRADYEYVDFGTVKFNFKGDCVGMPINQKQSNDIHFSNLSAGLSYAF